MKKLITATLLAFAFASPSFAASHAAAAPMADKGATCAKNADDKKLAGAARNSFMKKCEKDAGAKAMANPACEKSADEKKLAGAARKSHIKKCSSEMKKG